MLNILKELGIDLNDRLVIQNLYHIQNVAVRINGNVTESCQIGKTVSRGCCLSPVVFSLYAEMMNIERMENINEGVKEKGS